MKAFLLLLLLFIIAQPAALVLSYAFNNLSVYSDWGTTIQSALPELLATTAQVGIFAICFSLILGGLPAWLTHRFSFPGRQVFSFLVLAPLAVPAVALLGLYQEATNSEVFSSPSGLGLAFGIACAPYVFLLLRVALARTSPTFREAAKTLGLGPLQRFLFLHVPLLAIPLLASSALVDSEMLSDFATSERAGVNTFSLALHNLWMGTQRNDIAVFLASSVIIALIVTFAFVIFLFQKFTPQNSATGHPRHQRMRCRPFQATLVLIACIAAVTPGFLFPIFHTIKWATQKAGTSPLKNLANDTFSSVTTSAIVLLLTLAISLVLVFLLHAQKQANHLRAVTAVSLFNYAMPALVLVLAFFISTNEQTTLARVFPSLNNTRIPLITATALRFLPFILLPLVDTLSRIPSSLAMAGRVLGCSEKSAFARVLLPSLKPAIVVGSSLIFVECMKEITIAQALRPFEYSALSLRIFNYTTTHQAPETAVWVLVLQLVIFYPILRLQEFIEKE